MEGERESNRHQRKTPREVRLAAQATNPGQLWGTAITHSRLSFVESLCLRFHTLLDQLTILPP